MIKYNAHIVSVLDMGDVTTRMGNLVVDHGNLEKLDVINSYKRRLVCNTCEKAKLREEGIKKLSGKFEFCSCFHVEFLRKEVLLSRRELVQVVQFIPQQNV